ncbi:hypothetical protein CRYUN_Cryun01aG0007200 [Craigia yunnanensis]
MKSLAIFQYDDSCMALMMDGSAALGLDLSFLTPIFNGANLGQKLSIMCMTITTDHRGTNARTGFRGQPAEDGSFWPAKGLSHSLIPTSLRNRMEEHVISCAHRMGATCPIYVETLAMRCTIEEQMLKFLQDADACGKFLKEESQRPDHEGLRTFRQYMIFLRAII